MLIGAALIGLREVKMQINYLDLFSGVGGFTRGLLDAGFTFGWHGFSEIDKHAVKLYQGLYPDAEAMGDITKISTDELIRLSRRIGGIDIITFGFPCQDLSIAGSRKGLDGKRSGLFFEALRIIEAVRPDCFIFENVKGLFSSKGGADFKAVLQAVADLGLYDCQWQLLNTRWFLPQNRERIYFVGLLRGQQLFGRKIFPIGEKSQSINASGFEAEVQIASCLQSGGSSHIANGEMKGMNLISYSKQGRNPEIREDLPPLRSHTGCGHDNYIAYQKTHSKCVTQHFNEIGTLQAAVMIIDPQGRKNKDCVPKDHCPTLRSESHGNQPCVVYDLKTPSSSTRCGGVKEDETPPTLDHNCYLGVQISTNTSKGFEEAFNGDSINLSVPSSKTRRGRVGKAIAQTLDTQCNQATLFNKRIRRLTPLECFRLQFGMRNAAEMIAKAQELNISDTQLYKMAGNAVSSPVVQCIAERLVKPEDFIEVQG